LMVSTFSIATSFAAVYLTARRDYRFSMAYAFNDIVLIILWALAAKDNITYLSMVICFCSFLCMDCYTYFSWQRLKKKQAEG
ncbi:MAG: nicotinamide mononucleotide transporter family protein, partial [Clostridia bacterium]|nr:nicotinamide mononucleotide transporter family protein [Clostridia bacterium]